VSSAPDLTSRVLRYERAVVASAIAIVALLAWFYLAAGAGIAPHQQMAGMEMAGMAPPLPALVAMWSVMMAAMMLPSAAPTILLYARVRQQRGGDSAIAGSAVFLAGYLLVWFGFSVAAAIAQQRLTGQAMYVEGRSAPAALLLAAGMYQLSPLKTACLRMCRSPAEFLARHWRPGVSGAVRLGMLHGAWCLGCCWALMALLFVGGVMNLAWVLLVAFLVAVEKLLPRGPWVARATGAAMLVGGGAILLSV
jgi:predicted metal-binding membrane protein